MNDDEKKAIVQHIRGATVVHTSPFSSIQVPTANDILSRKECDKFVSPFYRVSFVLWMANSLIHSKPFTEKSNRRQLKGS
jgi:hypothetical protein